MIDKINNPVDIHVGVQLRKKRLELNISQEELGNAIGITFQQVQKYEKGHNRISSRVLYHISRILNVKIEYFFNNLPDSTYENLTELNRLNVSLAEPKATYGSAKHIGNSNDKEASDDEALIELVKNFKSITNEAVKMQILTLVKTLSKQ